MKRVGNLITKIAEPDNLRLAFWKARKGKNHKEEVIHYRKKLDVNLFLLREQILKGKVEVGNYHYFKIYDPKERIICAASFGERVLHHAIMNVCNPIFEDFQLYHSYATRKGKGTYAALDKATEYHKQHQWFLKLDMRKYFDSIDHQILLELLSRRFKDWRLMEIFEQIIASYHTAIEKGIPIGNLTSQYFANYYLAYADRYVKQELKIPAAVRYMDDVVLWSNDKAELLTVQKKLTIFLKDKLQLSLKISFLNRSQQGLSFLGYRIFPNCVRLNIRSKKRFKDKMKSYHQNLQKAIWTQEEYQRHILPLLAFTQYAATKTLRQEIITKLEGQSS